MRVTVKVRGLGLGLGLWFVRLLSWYMGYMQDGPAYNAFWHFSQFTGQSCI